MPSRASIPLLGVGAIPRPGDPGASVLWLKDEKYTKPSITLAARSTLPLGIG